MIKNLLANAGDAGLMPRSGRSPGEENGNPLQYSCLENPMDRGAWRATVHGVAKSRTRLRDFTFTFFHIVITTMYNYYNYCVTLLWITKENLLCSTGNSTQPSVVTYMGRKSKIEGIYVYKQLIHFIVQQKLIL